MNYLKQFWEFLKKDTWTSWIVSLILIIVLIKFIFFPLISLITGSQLPIVIVQSCSMYHNEKFDDWWFKNSAWYENKGISKEDFESYTMKNGFTKGDIIFVWGRSNYKKGDIIIFQQNSKAIDQTPIIHRIVSENPRATKGDNNNDQLNGNNRKNIDETSIEDSQILGKATLKIPAVGWIKLAFFELFRTPEERGFC